MCFKRLDITLLAAVLTLGVLNVRLTATMVLYSESFQQLSV